MKLLFQKALVMLSLIFASTSLWACDLCNLYLSINPNDFQHSINLNYRYRSQSATLAAGPQFRKLHPGSGYFSKDTHAQERFQTLDIWANFFPVQKVQLSLAVPVTQHSMLYNSESAYQLSGVGDITLLGLYQVHNTTCDTVNVYRQRLSIGGGVKLPTGAYKTTDENNQLYNPHMQIGTGSTDAILATEYLARFKNWGFSANLTYRMSTRNAMGYAFANRFNSTSHFFYLQQLFKGQLSIMPKMGFYYEQAENDLQDQELVTDSGGKVLMGSYGGSIFWKKFSLSGLYQPVINEYLYGKQFPNDSRFIFSVTWFIPSKFISM